MKEGMWGDSGKSPPAHGSQANYRHILGTRQTEATIRKGVLTMNKMWKLALIGSNRLLHGIWDAGVVAGCIVALTWIVPRLINLLATEPVQLRDPASSAILGCKTAMILWAFLVGLGRPD